MAQQRLNYYSNPAFCQKSEYYSQQEYSTSPRPRALSPERRHSPVGAQKPSQAESYSSPPKIVPKPRTLPRKNIPHAYNNEHFEEMLVDETSVPKRKQEVDNYPIEDQTNGNRPYAYVDGNDNEARKSRYIIEEEYIEEPRKSRYEYIPMQEQGMRPQKVIRRVVSEQEVEGGRVHRYAIIPSEELPQQRYAKEPAQRTNQGRYAEIPETVQKRYSKVPQEESQRSNHGRYEEIPDDMPQRRIEEPPRTNQGRYAEIPKEDDVRTKGRYAVVPVHEPEIQGNRYAVVPPESRYQNKNRYEYIPDDGYHEEVVRKQEYPHNVRSPQTPRKGNPEATQKLHELLITPQKFQKPQIISQKVRSPPLQKQIVPTPENFRTPKKTPPKSTIRQQPPKAQQKLNYTLSTRQNVYDKRQNTAVIAPICSSPVQSVYSETTFSNKTESWMNLSLQKPPAEATLAVAAIMMILCGSVSSGLCFYMVSIVGRMYYLDFGIISGFACLLLGCLGFRTRNCNWLPMRNYISGYIVLSVFSLLTCAGLLVLLFLQPKPGSALADVTSGAVCGISGLSLILASTGVIASYCRKYPPPDNRVQPCTRGFTV